MFLSTCEVLTKNGWITLPENKNKINDVATFDPNSGKIEFVRFKYKFEPFSGDGIIVQNRLVNIIVPAYSRILINQQAEINCYIRSVARLIEKRGLTSFPTSGYYEGTIKDMDKLILYFIGTLIARGKIMEDFIELFIDNPHVAEDIKSIMQVKSIEFTEEIAEIDEDKLTTFKIFNYKELPFIKYFDETLHPLITLIDIHIEDRIFIIDGILNNCMTKAGRYIYINNDVATQEFIRILMLLTGYNSYIVAKAYSGLTTSIKEEPYATVHHSNFDKSIIEANLNNIFISGKNEYDTVIVKYTDKIFVVHTDDP